MPSFSVLPWIATAAVMLGAVVWQYEELAAQQAAHRREHRQLGEAVLNAVDGLLEQEFRGGRYLKEELQNAVQDASARFQLPALAIVLADGTTLTSVGDPPARWSAEQSFEKVFAPHRPPGRGPRWNSGAEVLELPRQPMRLHVALATDGLAAELAADRRRMVVTTGALVLTIGALAGLFWSRLRALRLGDALAASKARTEGLETLRRLGAGLVHETKNPLGVVRGHAERIARGQLDAATAVASARAIVEEADRTVARLDEFLLLSRPAEVRRVRFPLRAMFDELAAMVEPDLAAVGGRCTVNCGGCQIDADRDQLRRLFLNLLLNAIQALEPGGGVELGCECRANGVLFWVDDDGRGVPEALRATLFEPYVSGRPGGTGLGLAIARRIAEDHGFRIGYQPRTPRGTRFFVEAPA